jgi:hypothetical protein
VYTDTAFDFPLLVVFRSGLGICMIKRGTEISLSLLLLFSILSSAALATRTGRSLAGTRDRTTVFQ